MRKVTLSTYFPAMPAKSKSQQRFFGMVRSGKIDKPEGMSDADVKKFAKTKHKGLPEAVPENARTLSFKEFLDLST